MARRSSTPAPDEDFEERIIDVDVADELSDSYREYAYSVIYSRAIPDARDGLKPVHRRILFQMNEMGLRPDRGFVKCARVVGDVMGKLHPHSDTAIYDSMVRMAQPWAMRIPLVAGHGNFGSLGGDDPPAAMRYTEARLSPAAMIMTGGIDEDTVEFGPNYDGQELEPEVLPSAFPNLLVNGSAGIAVGMATNMPPHNLAEVVAAARHLIKHPGADLDTLMGFVPGPDLPTGGRIIGEAGIRDAYETGRGVFRMRATATIEPVLTASRAGRTARRDGIVVTELPFNVGPEKVIAKVKELVQAKRVQGITDLKDLSDRFNGLRLVIEVKAGFNPEAILEQLYKLTPMEESFGINNVALVDGQPLTLGLKELLEVYLDHRFEVVRRRTTFRRTKRQDRLHLVEGLLVALVDIDRVIRLIRESDDAAAAKDNLMTAFALSDKQATYILDTPLRRLTRFDKLELEGERDKLTKEIKELTAILDSDALLRKVVSDELAAVAKEFGTPRRSVLVEGGMPVVEAVPLEISDDPVRVLLSATGLLARTPTGELTLGSGGDRVRSDAIVSVVATTIRGEVGAVTDQGRLIRFPVIDLPVLQPSKTAPSLAGGAAVAEFVRLEEDERVLCLCSLSPDSPGLALGTVQGVVKRVTPDYPRNRDVFEVITLKDGDAVAGAVELTTGEEELVFLTTDAQLLKYSATLVRPQGCPAGGMAGISLAEDQSVIFFGAVDPGRDALVVSMAGSDGVLTGVDAATTIKATPYALYPTKGRATGGVRCHRFLKGEHRLVAGWAVNAPAYAAAETGAPLALPPVDPRRDGSGTPVEAPIAHVTGPAPVS